MNRDSSLLERSQLLTSLVVVALSAHYQRAHAHSCGLEWIDLVRALEQTERKLRLVPLRRNAIEAPSPGIRWVELERAAKVLMRALIGLGVTSRAVPPEFESASRAQRFTRFGIERDRMLGSSPPVPRTILHISQGVHRAVVVVVR